MRTGNLPGAGLLLAAVLIQAGCSGQTGSEVEGNAGSEGKAITKSTTLPEGTPLVVRTISTMSTRTHQTGQTFSAHLVEPWIVDGREIAAKGTEVEGKVVGSDPGGRVDGRAALAVQLTGLRTAGGGKGAAIGAGAGAGAGSGVVLGTRGDPAETPGESVTLRTPVTIDS